MSLADGREGDCETAMRGCLNKIEEQEMSLKAFAWLENPQKLLQIAREADRQKAEGPQVPMCGVTVGIKDIIDAKDIPTRMGSPLFDTNVPKRDAVIVERLRAAGAIIIGKTTTTELAYMKPCETRNPWKLEHTPGGSSSGSAAAVAGRLKIWCLILQMVCLHTHAINTIFNFFLFSIPLRPPLLSLHEVMFICVRV